MTVGLWTDVKSFCKAGSLDRADHITNLRTAIFVISALMKTNVDQMK